MAYLFLENNGNCGNVVRTGVIIDFLAQLKIRGLEPNFLITDKDFAQISAACFVWKNIKIQLCLWHIKKAVLAKLSSSKNSQVNYNGLVARQKFSFIDPSFKPTTKDKGCVCPKELCQLICNFMNKHLHQHPIIPTIDGQFLSSDVIWTMAVEEAYNFCVQHSLPHVWAYLWNEWYSPERWKLWLRAGCCDKISILKTNMFVEAHWKVLKRDFLYKFFRPRLDLVVYVIMEQVIPHNQRKFEQVFLLKREKAEWRKVFKKEWKELSMRTINNNTYLTDVNNWICGCPAFLTSRFFICKHLIKRKGAVSIEFFDQVYRRCQYPFLGISLLPIGDFKISIISSEGDNLYEGDDLQDCEELYNRLIATTERILEVLKGNIRNN